VCHAQNKQQGKGKPTTPLIKTNPKQLLVKPKKSIDGEGWVHMLNG